MLRRYFAPVGKSELRNLAGPMEKNNICGNTEEISQVRKLNLRRNQ